MVFHDLEVLAQKLQPTVEAMQKLFSAGAGSYYGDSLFFLSVAMHHIMPRGEWATGCPSPACSPPGPLPRFFRVSFRATTGGAQGHLCRLTGCNYEALELNRGI